MELIMIKDVENVGKKGDVVRVRDGYARNFLIPQGCGIAANRVSSAFVEEKRVRSAKRKENEKIQSALLAKKVGELKITIKAKAGEQDKLFGSVTTEQICIAVNEKGYSFKKKQIQMKSPIHSLGIYPVIIDVFPEVKATISVEVISEA